ncbi:MAG: transcriptional regulator, partial [Aeromicrobium sp.]|nr:transcriptional regulator [Aeromicrobium sp.]
MDRPALADFLRRRREALQPADVGLTVGPRRRAPGLRREEVAHLTGMSVDYYARLEQARSPQPSTQMLRALARTLRLSEDESDHLHRLSGHAAPDRKGSSTYVRPVLLRVIDQLDDCAAFVVSDLGAILAQNRLSRLL